MPQSGPTAGMSAQQFLDYELDQLRVSSPKQYAALKVATKVVETFTEMTGLQRAFDQATGSKFTALDPYALKLNSREAEILNVKNNAYPTLPMALASIAREYELRLISERRDQVSSLWKEAERAFTAFKPDALMSEAEGFAAEAAFRTPRQPK